MLPSIEEAWSLPIPAELTSRQGALNTAQAQQVRSSLYKRLQPLGNYLNSKFMGTIKAAALLRYFQMFYPHQTALMFLKFWFASVANMDYWTER